MFKKLVMLLPLAIAIGSCEEEQAVPGLNDGEWHLMSVHGGLAGINDIFEPGLITWTFDESKVTITNTNTDNTLQDIFESGVYDYELEVSGQTNVNNLVVDGMNLGYLYQVEDSLTVDQRHVDGFQLDFIRFRDNN